MRKRLIQHKKGEIPQRDQKLFYLFISLTIVSQILPLFISPYEPKGYLDHAVAGIFFLGTVGIYFLNLKVDRKTAPYISNGKRMALIVGTIALAFWIVYEITQI